MHLQHGLHLAYCTNIHRGESWADIFAQLVRHTLVVKERVSAGQPYAIGLRLGYRAALELSEPSALHSFQKWLDRNDCYIFTVNGFPYGDFHGVRVKEQVYRPDWTTVERLDYTKLLFALLAKLAPKHGSASVSTVPGSYKAFGIDAPQLKLMFQHLKELADYLEDLSVESEIDFHLGLEPEPLCLFETTGETLKFFAMMFDQYPDNEALLRRIGVNYDACHLAVEFEEPMSSLERLTGSGLRLSKLHLSSALKLAPTPEALARLAQFQDQVYLHQTVIRDGDEPLRRFADIPDALAYAEQYPDFLGEEWRVHFHIPLHDVPDASLGLRDTRDHTLGALDYLARHPDCCKHLEMETYTWEVLPQELKSHDITGQLVKEYEWTLAELKKRGLA